MATMTHVEEFEEAVFTVTQVSKIIRSNPEYVRKLIRSGNLKAIRLGELKIPSSELKSFLQRSLGTDLTDPFNPKPLEFVK